MQNLPPFLRETREEFEKSCMASYAVISKNTSRLYQDNYEPCKYRTEFQRDRDRIIHSKAFRRLMDKTQVYMVLEGDHYRNRLSHTLEVSQVAKALSTYLGLNTDLVEAIALGHDLGHTPFGHAVEDVLNNILKHNCGFKHSYQSLMVVDLLENKDFSEAQWGLNLTNHTRYGILNHTKTNKEISIYNNSPDNIVTSNEFKSIESELVAKTDTLTYLCHDLEDAIKSKHIFDDMRINNGSSFKEFINKLNDFNEIACKVIQQEPFIINSDLSNFKSGLILKALIEDLVEGTSEQIRQLKIKDVEDVKNCREPIVKFNIFEQHFVDFKKFLTKYVYTSPLAQQMDTKARYIVTKLYESFYENPEQLPYRTRELYNNAQKGFYSKRKDSGYILIPERVICNYIAGMTDRYALENFKRMFSANY